MKYYINPLKGVNKVELGASRDDVIALLGSPSSSNGNCDHYNGAHFQIHYDGNNKVEYIELYRESSNYISAFIKGKDVFSLEKQDAIEHISKSFDTKPEEGLLFPKVCTFEDLELSFWSDSSPSDFTEELKTQHPEDYNKSLYYETVGIGVKGYFS